MRQLDGLIDSMDIEQTLGDSEGQGSLACCSLWGRKELDMNEQQHNLLGLQRPITNPCCHLYS